MIRSDDPADTRQGLLDAAPRGWDGYPDRREMYALIVETLTDEECDVLAEVLDEMHFMGGLEAT